MKSVDSVVLWFVSNLTILDYNINGKVYGRIETYLGNWPWLWKLIAAALLSEVPLEHWEECRLALKWIHAAAFDKIVLCATISLLTMVLAPDETISPRSIEEGRYWFLVLLPIASTGWPHAVRIGAVTNKSEINSLIPLEYCINDRLRTFEFIGMDGRASPCGEIQFTSYSISLQSLSILWNRSAFS